MICVIVFIVQQTVSGFTEMFLLDGNAFTQVWRLVTAIFLHGSMSHLISNLFALIMFGIFLEGIVGSRKFLYIFFVTGIGANIVSALFYPSSLGASGAIFGIIGALIAVRPLLIVFAFGIPMPIFLAGIIWVALDLVGVFVPSNVANIAHLVGVFLGLVYGYFLRGKSTNYRGNSLSLNEIYVRKWEDHYLK